MTADTDIRSGFQRVETCLWCGSEDLVPCVDEVQDWFYGAMDGYFAFDRCGNCASLLLRERPGPERIGEAYRNYYTLESGNSGKTIKNSRSIIGRAIKSAYGRYYHGGEAKGHDALTARLLALLPGRRLAASAWFRFLPPLPGEVLDYGCGNGDFLARAAKLGHSVIGVDFDKAALEIASSRGFEVHHTAVLDWDAFHARFDLVSANHVIEHLADPREVLATFHAWLKPGGRLYLECPNAEARGLGHFGSFWRGLEAPRHFSLPSRDGMKCALEDAGFSRVDWHDRSDPHKDMAAQSQAARMLFGTFPMQLPETGRFEDTEFLTLVAHRDG